MSLSTTCLSVCVKEDRVRDVKLSRDFIYFFFSPTFLFFFRAQKKFSCNIISHTQHQVNLVIGMRDIRKILKRLIGIRDIRVLKRFWELI